MRTYEITYLISDNVPESDLNKVTGKINGYVTALSGKVLKEEIWGRRKLAYPIKKQDFATYITINIELPADKANELERDIRLSSKIVRHLMILKDFGQEALSLSADEIVDTEAIEEVIGGEKSFEVIEGETEESKDLMAVREKEVSEEETAKPEVKEEKVEVEEGVEVEEVKAEKPTKDEKVKKPTKVEEKEKKETKAKKKAETKKEPKEDEADRLSKLDKELDDILGEDL